jgi:EpsI family protein
MERRTGLLAVLAWPHLIALLAMLAAAGLAVALAPKKADAPGETFDLNALVPIEFGEWREIRSALVQVDLTPRRDDEERKPTTNNPYDQTVMRTYVRRDGAVIMLALAYGSRQRQEVKIHRPELCYIAQGFQVGRKEHAALTLNDGRSVALTRLMAESSNRVEPVTYWIRIGEEISQSAWQSRLAILREGFQGRIPDGILVRVSTPYPKGQFAPADYGIHSEFLLDLLSSLEPRAQRLLVGHSRASALVS